MYIPPMFDFYTRELIDENVLRSWAVQNGGVWYPAGEKHYSRWTTSAKWEFERYDRMADTLTAKVMTVTDEYAEDWAQQIQMRPQGRINIEIDHELFEDSEACVPVLSALFQQWDGYAYDLGCHDWVSRLLADCLPGDRIIRYDPPPRPPTPWIWVGSKYVKNARHINGNDTASGRAGANIG